jgi:hypothetical protein
MEVDRDGDAVRTRQCRRTKPHDQRTFWGKFWGHAEQQEEKAMNTNRIDVTTDALGKGEVVSSILTGSTIGWRFSSCAPSPGHCHFRLRIRDDILDYGTCGAELRAEDQCRENSANKERQRRRSELGAAGVYRDVLVADRDQAGGRISERRAREPAGRNSARARLRHRERMGLRLRPNAVDLKFLPL